MPYRCYDSIIYGNNLAAVHYAANLHLKGDNVLLIAPDAYFGESMTAGLSIVQKIMPASVLKYSRAFYRKVKISHRSPENDKKYFLFNAEEIKFGCMAYLTDIKLDMLLYLKPLSIRDTGQELEIQFMGREGKIEISAKRLFDLSENYAIISLLNDHLLSSGPILNMQLKSNDLNISELTDMKLRQIGLGNGISILQLTLNDENGEYAAASQGHGRSQKIFHELDLLCRKNGCYIELYPARPSFVKKLPADYEDPTGRIIAREDLYPDYLHPERQVCSLENYLEKHEYI